MTPFPLRFLVCGCGKRYNLSSAVSIMCHRTYCRHLENVVSFKNALFLPTAKRDLNLASLFDREDREMAPRKSSFPFAGIIKTKWHVLTQRVSATSPIQYFKKSAVEIRSLCLADSSSYRGKLRKACS